MCYSTHVGRQLRSALDVLAAVSPSGSGARQLGRPPAQARAGGTAEFLPPLHTALVQHLLAAHLNVIRTQTSSSYVISVTKLILLLKKVITLQIKIFFLLNFVLLV